uniref:Globin-like protein n=1 Tax=Exaiptasia diaphana TaxID=2652724 RepID=A0A2K9UYS0_EXADI|nr:globin-like protein [Exaiptasia diaphana]
MGCTSSSNSSSGTEIHFSDKLRHTKSADLTWEQKYLIRETWKFLENYKSEIGISVYKRFLTIHPELKIHFKEFRSIEISEINGLHGHPKRVMTAIDDAVTTMGDSEEFYAYLFELGKRHADLDFKISRTHFDDLRKSFILSIMERLDSTQFRRDDVEGAWDKMFCTITTMMLKGLSHHHSN